MWNNQYWLKQENSKEREHALLGLNHIFDPYISQFLHIMQDLGYSKTHPDFSKEKEDRHIVKVNSCL